jgi:transposase InsO family protein
VRLRQLAEQHPRWGSPRLTWLLRREGCVVNHNKVERLYREEGLTVRRRRRKRVSRTPAELLNNGEIARARLQQCFPARRVTLIPSTDLAWGLGSFHCITQQWPALPDPRSTKNRQ